MTKSAKPVVVMDGSAYVACVELTRKDGTVLAKAGESCARVPTESLGWLLAQQLIKPDVKE